MKWILLAVNLASLGLSIYALIETLIAERRIAEVHARLDAFKAERVPMGVVEIRLDSKELVEELRQMLEDQGDDGEGWKRGKEK